MGTSSSEKELVLQVVEEIRKNSAEKVCLTTLEAFKQEPYALEEEELSAILAELEDNQEYGDIKILNSSANHKLYLYSGASMSDSYARALLRKEVNNPCWAIAETVREESRVYPRPTSSQVLGLPPLNLELSKLPEYLQELKSNAEYSDIQWFKASTDAIYLYSDKYLSKDHASYLAEWFEVGQFENQ